jgi:hypothetical protein
LLLIAINGVEIDQQTVQQLDAMYRTRMVNGAFWYDPVSGLWGVWGGPASYKGRLFHSQLPAPQPAKDVS